MIPDRVRADFSISIPEDEMNVSYWFCSIRRLFPAWLLILGVAIHPAAGLSDDKGSSLKDDARKAGRATGDAVREVGQGLKQAGKEIGSAAKEGGKEFRRAVKGNNK